MVGFSWTLGCIFGLSISFQSREFVAGHIGELAAVVEPHAIQGQHHQQATRQASEVAEANFEAAADSAVKASQTATQAATRNGKRAAA